MSRYSFLFALYLSLQTASLSGNTPAQKNSLAYVHQIAKGNTEIKIHTDPNYSYIHLEGADPDWKLGMLKRISQRHSPIPGDGEVHRFKAKKRSSYHMVEVIRNTGAISINILGEIENPIAYFISDDSQVVSQGQIQPGVLKEPVKIKIPYGEYHIQLISVGNKPIPEKKFSLSSTQTSCDLEFVIDNSQTALQISSSPEHLITNHPAIIRCVDPIKQKTLWAKEIILNGQPVFVPPGQYTVEFPEIEGYNSPGYQGTIGRFVIEAGQTIKTISGKYTKKEGSISLSFSSNTTYRKAHDKIRCWLKDESGTRTFYPDHDNFQLTQDGTGKEFVIPNLQPGKYLLGFTATSRDEDWVFPTPKTIEVIPGKQIVISEKLQYVPVNSTLKIVTGYPEAKFKIISLLDDSEQEGFGSEFTFTNLKPGAYIVRFSPSSDSKLVAPAQKEILIESNISQDLSVPYEKIIDLVVYANTENYEIEAIRNDREQPTLTVKATSKEQAIQLPEGIYSIHLFTIDSQTQQKTLAKTIEVDLQNTNLKDARERIIYVDQEQQEIATPKELGNLVIVYDTGVEKERLERVRFWVIDAEQQRVMYPSSNNPAISGKEEYQKQVVIPELVAGTYNLQFLIPNQDGLFTESKIIQTVEIKPNETITIQQTFKANYSRIAVTIDAEDAENVDFNAIGVKLCSLDGKIVAQSQGKEIVFDSVLPGHYELHFPSIENYVTPSIHRISIQPGAKIDRKAAYKKQTTSVIIQADSPEQKWSILSSNKEIVLQGKGNMLDVLLPVGKTYEIKTESLEGFESKIYPASSFTTAKDNPVSIEIKTQKAVGTLKFTGIGYPDDTMQLKLYQNNSLIKTYELHSSAEGIFELVDSSLPIGTYKVNWSLPESYIPNAPKEFTCVKDTETLLEEKFSIERVLQVDTNYAKARFSLISQNTGKKLQGWGESYYFYPIEPGQYELHCDPVDSRENPLIAPEVQVVSITKEQNEQIRLTYQKQASLLISSNISNYSVEIKQGEKILKRDLLEESELITLPEGKYQLQFLPLINTRFKKEIAPPSEVIDIQLSQKKPVRIYREYPVFKGSLIISSNLPEAKYTLLDLSEKEPKVIGKYQGQFTLVNELITGTYKIEFEQISNCQTPDNIVFEVQSNERIMRSGVYVPIQEMVRISKGPMLLGDTFHEGEEDELPVRTIELSTYYIAKYPVSNAQYADWLTKAHRKGDIRIEISGTNRGIVFNKKNQILCGTYLSHSDSQVFMQQGDKGIVFNAISGKEDHPMIYVSWYGAFAYSKDNGCRLATEAEWEKAAGTPKENGLSKYRYGFSRNTIDPTCANYIESSNSARSYSVVRTKKNGFYNGINLLQVDAKVISTIRAKPEKLNSQYGTALAESPWGLYDMSGNVREWVADWYDAEAFRKTVDINPKGPEWGKEKVIKGGCFDSVQHELRVAARMSLSPESLDPYTGFRLVKGEE